MVEVFADTVEVLFIFLSLINSSVFGNGKCPNFIISAVSLGYLFV